MRDDEVRQQIIDSKENTVIVAGAGSGKTTLLTEKIINEIRNNKTHYKLAAITFTQKATDELKVKLIDIDDGNFIGTNDSFVEREIIRPFITDAYGEEYDSNFIVSYKSNKFTTFEDGLKTLKDKNMLCTYSDTKRNFKFHLGLEILKKSIVAQQYITSKYSWIYIDEYQDTDSDMHNFFMYIKHLGVKFVIVGDSNQCIYEWRGANPDLFMNLESSDNFCKYQLTMNFRCPIGVQNYSNIITHEDNTFYESNINDDVIWVKNNYLKCIKYADINKEICVLVRYHNQAEQIVEILNNNGFEFVYIPRSPIEDIGTVNKSIYIELAKYYYSDSYSHYSFINNMSLQLDKSEISELKSILSPLKKGITKDGIIDIANKILLFLSIKENELNEIENLCNTLLNNKYANAYNDLEFKHKIMTFFSAKGLEFEQVILSSGDYDLCNKKNINDHYVATTRAKEKLIININEYKYSRNVTSICHEVGINLLNLVTKK